MYTIPEKGTMEEVSKPYGVVTDDCVELVGKDAVSIANKKGLRFKPDLLPTVHPDRGLTLTFWLKVERISVSCDGIDVVFHCGSGSYQTPTMWFRGHSTQAYVHVAGSGLNRKPFLLAIDTDSRL